jgi:hypothetical protein
MAIPAVIHILGEDAVLGDLDELPNPTHNFVLIRNMRKKDGKPLPYIADGATAFLYGWSRITFIELMSDVAGLPHAAAAAAAPATAVLGFFRDDDR